jgi:hypothetical protein
MKKTRKSWLESRNIVLLVYIQIWNSNDVWWGNMQIIHILIRVSSYFLPNLLINSQCDAIVRFILRMDFLAPLFSSTFHQQRYPQFQRWFQGNNMINTRIHASVTFTFFSKNGFNKNEYFFQFYFWRYSVKTHGVYGPSLKASSVYKIELRPLISGLDFALLEVRNLYITSRLFVFHTSPAPQFAHLDVLRLYVGFHCHV